MAKDARYLRPGEEQSSPEPVVRLSFHGGTVVVRDLPRDAGHALKLRWDDRVGHHRAPAAEYRLLVGALLRAGHTVLDEAREFDELALTPADAHVAHPHQEDALEAWLGAGRRGVVVLPTGSGKSYLAELAMQAVQRDTLVVAPTLDLVDQWARRLSTAFAQPIGAIGGGRYQIERITVSTYDSAAIHMDRLGGRFGLLVFDEVHHLPGEVYRQAAEASIAPFRLGLTATLEREDGRHAQIETLVGPTVFRLGIKELAGDILADYDVETVEVGMSEEDRAAYDEARAHYRGFVERAGIRVGGRDGWRNFLAATSRSPEGRAALAAYHRQKRLALSHSRKIEALCGLLRRHWGDRTIVFANDNATVYAISERFLCPTITHQTPLAERTQVLERFARGEYRVVVTSRVLNEGVDVPAASVAIVLSGSSSVREHVQRLGRILRKADGKRARLYELVTTETVEAFQSQRRREHDAYR